MDCIVLRQGRTRNHRHHINGVTCSYVSVEEEQQRADEVQVGDLEQAKKLFQEETSGEDTPAEEPTLIGSLIGSAGQATAQEVKFAMILCLQVPPEDQEEFDDFYALEHASLLLKCPDWLTCRRYEVVESRGKPFTRVVIHELGDLSALDSKERRDAMTPWRSRIAARPWFKSMSQICYRVVN